MPDVHVSRSEQDRRRGRAIVRQRREQVAEEAQQERRQERRRPYRQRERQERRVHGADVRGIRGKEVVHVEVDQAHGQEGRDPMPHRQDAGDALGEPGQQAQLAQLARQHDEHREPDQGVPAVAFPEDVLPGQDAGRQHRRHPRQRRRRGADAERPACNPEAQQQDEYRQQNLLVPRHRAQLREPLPRNLRCGRRVGDLWWVQAVDQKWHEQQAQQSRDGGRRCP